MADNKVDTNKSLSNQSTIIIAVTIVVLAAVFMFYRDKQKQRNFQLERLDTQAELWEHRGPPTQNRQMNNTAGQNGGKVL